MFDHKVVCSQAQFQLEIDVSILPLVNASLSELAIAVQSKSSIDRLPAELLLVIFDLVYSTQTAPVLHAGLSQRLEPLQRIYLYRKVRIDAEESLRLFVRTITESSSEIGALVRILHVHFWVVEPRLFDHSLDQSPCVKPDPMRQGILQPLSVYNLLPSVSPFLFNLTHLAVFESRLGDSIIPLLSHFTGLERIDIALTSDIVLDHFLASVFRIPLKDVHISLARVGARLAGKRNPSDTRGERPHCFNRLSINAVSASLELFTFVESIRARSVSILFSDMASNTDDVVAALASIHCDAEDLVLGLDYPLALMPSSHQLSPLHLAAFVHLTSLSLMRGIRVATSFFTHLLDNNSRIQHLSLGYEFDLIAIDLLDSIRSSSLKTLTLDVFIEELEDLVYENVNQPYWPEMCSREDAGLIASTATARGAKVQGTIWRAFYLEDDERRASQFVID